MNVAVISSWHVHAKGYAQNILENPNCKIIGVYDERYEEGKEWAKELNCKFYENYDELLSNSGIEAVCICSPTNIHAEMIIKAANAGKHVFTEKVLALNSSDAYAIRNAVKKNNIKFAISYPHKCFPTLLFAKNMIDSGELGKITYVRVRNVHSGSINDWLPPHFYDKEQCGGGAMIDLGAHPMYILQWLLGSPQSVTSTFTNVTSRPVEDNAVSVLEYESGAIGVSETGFVSLYNPYTVEISGTKGYLVVSGNDLFYANKKTEGKLQKAELPPSMPLPLFQWLDNIISETPMGDFGIDSAVSLVELMEAAYAAYHDGRKVNL